MHSERRPKCKRAKVDAVIAVHMFGNVCNVPEVRDGWRKADYRRLCFIAWQPVEWSQPELWEIGVFSFRSGKYLSVGEGGALYANDPELR